MSRPTLVVVAGELDEEARALPARLPHLDVRLLTPADLSCAGWEFRPGGIEGVAVVGGRLLASEELDAVLVRLPWVREEEMVRIDAADRAYAAAEMSAFLLAWLSSLRCPVVNRPSTTCLCGPLWRPQRWTIAAAAVGLPVEAVKWVADAGAGGEPPAPGESAVIATVVGERCLGAEDAGLVARLCTLARLAGAEVLTVGLSDATANARFVTASPWPDLSDGAILDAVVALTGLPSGAAKPVVPA